MSPYARWLPRLIGPAILGYFLLTTDIARIALNLGRVHWAPVAASLALYPAFATIKAWRWRALLRSLGLDPPPLGSVLRLYMVGLFLGGATPGQSGDFLKAWFLRERGQPLGPALFSILLDRLFDFLIMALASLAGLVVLVPFFPLERQSAIRIAVLATAGAVALLIPALIARRTREWLMDIAVAVVPPRARLGLTRWRTQFAALELRAGLVGGVLAATVASAAVSMVRLWLLFRALDIGVPAAALISSVALIAILQAAPISFSGIGVRDAVLVALLTAYGYRTDEALALSALFLLLNLENIGIGFLASLGFRSVSPGPSAESESLPGAAAHDKA